MFPTFLTAAEACLLEKHLHKLAHPIIFIVTPSGCHECISHRIDHLELGTHKQNMEDKKKNPRPDKTPVKLTIEQKKEIAHAEGRTIPQLADEYNVAASTIVKARRTFGTKKNRRMPDKPSVKNPLMKRKEKTRKAD